MLNQLDIQLLRNHVLQIIQYAELRIDEHIEVLHKSIDELQLLSKLRLELLLRRGERISSAGSCGGLRGARAFAGDSLRREQFRCWVWTGVIVHSLLNASVADWESFEVDCSHGSRGR